MGRRRYLSRSVLMAAAAATSAITLIAPAHEARAETDVEITEFEVAQANHGLAGIAAGPDGNLWVTEQAGNRIDRVTPTGEVSRFDLPTRNASPFHITVGADGALWFTETRANQIGRITADGYITEFLVPTARSEPTGITVGPDGNLWFTEAAASKIGRITVDGVISEFRLPTGIAPGAIASGPDGNLWFAESSGNRIGRITTAGEIVEIVPETAAAGGLEGITAGPDGAMWFTERTRDRVGRITVDRVVTEFDVAVPGANQVRPSQLTTGPDGALWVTARSAGAILRVATDGSVETFSIPSPRSDPYGITAGPDDAVWFTETGTGKVGRIGPGEPPPPEGPGVSGVTLSVEPAAAAAGHEVTPALAVDPLALGNTAVLQSTPLASSPLASSPLASSPLASSPLASSPLASSPLASSMLLTSIPLASSSWQEVLIGSIYENVPLQTVTLGDVFDLPDADSRLAELTLAHIPLASSPLASSPLAAVLLWPVAIGALPAPVGGWCAFLASQPFNCSNGVDENLATLLDLEVTGDDLSTYYATQIELTGVSSAPLASSPLASSPLGNLNLAQTPVGAVPTDQVPSLVTCAPGDCAATLAEAQLAGQLDPTANVADLLALLPLPALPNLGLGDLIAAMIPPWELPYEHGPLSDILDQALIRADELLAYTTTFDLDCQQHDGLQVVLELVDGFRVAPGTSTLTAGSNPAVPLPEPTDDGAGIFGYDVATGGPGEPCDGNTDTDVEYLGTDTDVEHIGVSVLVEPSAFLGAYPGAVSVSTRSDRDAGTEATAAAGLATADDSHDQGPDPATAQPIESDTLYATHLSHGGDIDTFALAAPPAGTTLRVTLSHLPADYDLVVFGPDAGLAVSEARSSPLASSPLASSPLASSPVPDNSSVAGGDDANLAPNTLADVPLASSPLASSPLVVRGISIRRGTGTEAVSVPVTPSDQGGTFVIQVSGFNGASSPNPYILRTTVLPGREPLPCAARTFVGGGTPGALPTAIPGDTRALFLVNAGRMGDLYGASDTAGMLSMLEAVAARDDVRGVMVPVEGDAAVAAAYAAWDADPCSVEAANQVVNRINDLVDDLRTTAGGLPELRSIVLVGPDDALAQARVPDLAHLSNESEYGLDAAVGAAKDTAVSRALADGYVLTDDPYGDFDPRPWLNGQLYVPDVALGRLVESPAEIVDTLQRFVDFDGALDPQAAFVTGYDFMIDGATAMADALASAVPTDSRIDNTWTSADALAGLNGDAAGIAALNAHYDHYRALPAEEFFAGGEADLVTTAASAPAPGSILFTMGCHSGLNIPDIGVVSPSPSQQARLLDWAQNAGQNGAIFAGNTGFGYGDTEAVAYSERLLAYYAENLATGTMTAGQALLFAKQRYAGELGVAGVYDAKILEVSTFYGLPMWRIGADGAEAGPAALPPVSDPTEVTLRSSSFSVSPTTEEVVTDRGSYWVVPGEAPQVTHFNPIQPRLTVDVTDPDGLPVHGALLESLTSSDIPGVDPVFARPTIDLAADEPEVSATEAYFPAQIQGVHSVGTPDGRVDHLVLMPGQLRQAGGDATQRLFSQVDGTVYRSDSNDWSAPTIERVAGNVVNGGVTFTVVTPATDVARGNVLWRDDASNTWHANELLEGRDGTWSAGSLLDPGATQVTEFVVQFVDTSGNVSASTNKGVGYSALPISSEPGSLAIRQSPDPGPAGYADSPVAVTVEGIPDGHDASITIDGGQAFVYTGPFTISTDGVHVVEATVDDGSATAITVVAIDTTPPVITGTATPAPNDAGWNSDPVTVRFACHDATSGVASCPDDTTLSDDGAQQTVTGTATDRVGHAATTTVGPVNIDTTSPEVAATPDRAPDAVDANGNGWYNRPVTITFSGTDATSGIASCDPPVTYGAPDGASHTVTGSCTDLAGNIASATFGPFAFDDTAPITTVNRPPLGIALGAFTGTAFDETSGVGVVVVETTNRVLGTRTVQTYRCNSPGGATCEWRVRPPFTGIFDVRAWSIDQAGNVGPSVFLRGIAVPLLA